MRSVDGDNVMLRIEIKLGYYLDLGGKMSVIYLSDIAPILTSFRMLATLIRTKMMKIQILIFFFFYCTVLFLHDLNE